MSDDELSEFTVELLEWMRAMEEELDRATAEVWTAWNERSSASAETDEAT